MELVQLSNICNKIVQQLGGINFYHFGYRSDLNFNVRNNYTNGNNPACNYYPYLLMQAPTGVWNRAKKGTSRQLSFALFDRQDGNKQGATCETLLEKMSNLELQSISFVQALESYISSDPCLKSSIKSVNYSLSAYVSQDKLVACNFNVELYSPLNYDCVSIEVDPVNTTDDERL